MGRPKGGKNRRFTSEYKLKIIKRFIEDNESLRSIARKEDLSDGMIANQCTAYRQEGTEGLKPKKKGNPFAALHTSKSLTKEECLEPENLKLKIENERLKKGYLVKGGGAGKEYVSIFGKNTK